MTPRLQAVLRRVVPVLATMLAVGVATAQATHEPRDPVVTPSFSCGVVEASPAQMRYFAELCHAFASALRHPAHEILVTDRDGVLAALLDGSVDIALGLRWEGTGDAPIRHGPVALITPQARYGIAGREGDDRRLETVSWLFHALVEAEARGIDRAAASSDMEGVPDAKASMFRAYEQRLAGQLGLDHEAIRRMIAGAGHHGEIYARWFDLGFEANRPVELGGQLYAPPVGAP